MDKQLVLLNIKRELQKLLTQIKLYYGLQLIKYLILGWIYLKKNFFKKCFLLKKTYNKEKWQNKSKKIKKFKII